MRSSISLRYALHIGSFRPWLTKFKIVVIGDTSTGNSSVPQALTRLPFPVAGELCTRFITKTTLRRCGPLEGPGYNIEVKMDGASGTHAAPFLPKSYKSDKWVKVYQHLRENIDDAFNKIGPAYLHPPGIPQVGMQARQGSSTAGPRQLPIPQLLKHCLQITVRKPNQAHFSIVDIPGLVSSKSLSKKKSILRQPFRCVTRSVVATKLTQRQMERQWTSNSR
jgi:hypothetical protein